MFSTNASITKYAKNKYVFGLQTRHFGDNHLLQCTIIIAEISWHVNYIQAETKVTNNSSKRTLESQRSYK